MQKYHIFIKNRTELAEYLGISTKTLSRITKEADIHIRPRIMLTDEVIQQVIDAFNNRHKRKDDKE